VITLIADTLVGVISQAKDLYERTDLLPRPDGFRIREGGGDVIYEFREPQET
jgi:hypothetical protein